MFPQSRRLIVPILAVLITAGTLTAVAQTKSKSSKSKTSTTAKKETSKYHRLLPHYGQLKLKEEQIAEIYEIREEFGKKIDALEKELAKLKEDQAAKAKGVLTRTQVTALNKLIAGTAPKETKPKSSTAKKTTTKKKSSSSKSSTKKK